MRKISILCAFVLILLPVLASCDNKVPHNVNNTTSVPSEETPSVVSAMPTNEPATPTPTVTVEPTLTPEPTPTVPVYLFGDLSQEVGGDPYCVFVLDSLWDTIQYNHGEKVLYSVVISVGPAWDIGHSYLDSKLVKNDPYYTGVPIYNMEPSIQDEIVEKELERVRESGILVCGNEGKRVFALATEEQIRQFTPKNQLYYTIRWAPVGSRLLANVSGYTEISPTPTPTPRNLVHIDECGGKVSDDLCGDYEADEYVKIIIWQGDEDKTSLQLLEERYPEEYEACLWAYEADYDMYPNDSRWETADYAWNVLRVQIIEELRKERRDAFFARHPEWTQYQLDYDSWFVLKVPYSLIPEIAKDPGVTYVSWRRYTDTSEIRIIGEYDGCPVYARCR